MLSKITKDEAIYYIRILSAISFIFSGVYTIDAWINGGQELFFLPVFFYPFAFSSLIFAIASLSQ